MPRPKDAAGNKRHLMAQADGQAGNLFLLFFVLFLKDGSGGDGIFGVEP